MAKSSRRGTWIGFEMEFAKNININDWYGKIREGLDNKYTIGESNHSIYAAEFKNYLIGLILTYKNQKVYLEAIETEQLLKFVKNQIQQGHEGIEANLFAINPATRHGVIASLHGTISSSKVAKLFRCIHDKVKHGLIQERLDHLEHEYPDIDEKKLKKSVNKEYEGSFDFAYKLSKHDLETALSYFKDYERMNISFVDGLPSDSLFRPLSKSAHRAKIEVKFDKKNDATITASGIRRFFKGASTYKALKLYGRSMAGEQDTISLGENKIGYGKFSYDDYVMGLPTEWPNEIPTCIATAMIMEVIAGNPLIFGKPPKKSLLTR